ncbi:MAG: hypothetical protein MUC48_19775 [Leptolyngbya sp. Prado105]|nr:hypothetical protein [Leptolyngbya sp. Prado105]
MKPLPVIYLQAFVPYLGLVYKCALSYFSPLFQSSNLRQRMFSIFTGVEVDLSKSPPGFPLMPQTDQT